jgi:putative membrane protein
VASRIDTFFSDADRAAIQAATAEAERATAGELVVYVVERCDPHPEVLWKSALIGGALGAALGAIGVRLYGGWGAPDYLWLLIGLQLGLVAGWLASRFDSIARRLIPEEALESRVDGRAAEAFVEEQVFATERRTGVLIFVALFEHRVLILPDEGIEAEVDSAAWDAITSHLVAGLRAESPAQALIHSVSECAALLKAHGVGGDEANELSNEPRFRHD